MKKERVILCEFCSISGFSLGGGVALMAREILTSLNFLFMCFLLTFCSPLFFKKLRGSLQNCGGREFSTFSSCSCSPYYAHK